MKRSVVVGLWAFALAGTLPAQQPSAPVPISSTPADPQACAIVSATHGGGALGSCAPCPVPLKTICVAEPGTKVTVKPMYSKVSEPLCFPRFSLFARSSPCENGCATCAHPRTKHYLVLEPCVEERPAVVCKPVLVPACGGASPCAKGPVSAATPVAPVESLAAHSLPTTAK
jgi:hypothetical protein